MKKKDRKQKWCESPLQDIRPCSFGNGLGPEELKKCHDNCTNLVEQGIDYDFCKDCGDVIPPEDMPKAGTYSKPFFFIVRRGRRRGLFSEQ